jgi:hypothetical protein
MLPDHKWRSHELVEKPLQEGFRLATAPILEVLFFVLFYKRYQNPLFLSSSSSSSSTWKSLSKKGKDGMYVRYPCGKYSFLSFFYLKAKPKVRKCVPEMMG